MEKEEMLSKIRFYTNKLCELLNEDGATISVAESGLGSILSGCISEFESSHFYFVGSCMAQTPLELNRLLGIPLEQIELEGVVSKTVTAEMAKAVLDITDSVFSIAVTGHMEKLPDNFDENIIPVCICVASGDGYVVNEYKFNYDRTTAKFAAALEAIKLACSVINTYIHSGTNR